MTFTTDPVTGEMTIVLTKREAELLEEGIPLAKPLASARFRGQLELMKTPAQLRDPEGTSHHTLGEQRRYVLDQWSANINLGDDWAQASLWQHSPPGKRFERDLRFPGHGAGDITLVKRLVVDFYPGRAIIEEAKLDGETVYIDSRPSAKVEKADPDDDGE